MEEKETRTAGATPEATAGSVAAQEVAAEAAPPSFESEAARPPVQKATPSQRIAAAIAAAVVIVITIAYIYAIYTGALFSR